MTKHYRERRSTKSPHHAAFLGTFAPFLRASESPNGDGLFAALHRPTFSALAGFERPSFSAPHCASYRLARSLAIPSTARFFPLCHVSLPQFRRKSRRAGWFRELCLTHATSAKKQNSILKNKDGGTLGKTGIDHEGHKGTRRKQELPSCTFVSFVV